MTVDEVVILAIAGVSMDLVTDGSPMVPEGELIDAVADGKGEVRVLGFDADDDRKVFTFYPGNWFTPKL